MKKAKKSAAKPKPKSASTKAKEPYFGAFKKMKYAEWHKSWLKGLQVRASTNSDTANYYIQDILLT